MNTPSDLIDFQKILGYGFGNIELLKEALTHRSYAAEKKIHRDNQRLEFLGDAVIQIAVTEYLFARYPQKREGDLTAYRAAIVQKKSLAEMARRIELHKYIYLGKGESSVEGGKRSSTMCDAFEALMGAIYLDSGLESVKKVLYNMISFIHSSCPDLNSSFNSKGLLQEIVQKKDGSKPVYNVIETMGTEHDPVYTVEVVINGTAVACGTGKNRKDAESDAAGKAIRIIDGNH